MFSQITKGSAEREIQSVLFGLERVQDSLLWSKIVSGLGAALRRMWINRVFQSVEIFHIVMYGKLLNLVVCSINYWILNSSFFIQYKLLALGHFENYLVKVKAVICLWQRVLWHWKNPPWLCCLGKGLALFKDFALEVVSREVSEDS